jgi:hypothetical protein
MYTNAMYTVQKSQESNSYNGHISVRRKYNTGAFGGNSAGWGRGIFGGSGENFRGLMMDDLVQEDLAWLDKVIQNVGKEEVCVYVYVCICVCVCVCVHGVWIRLFRM